MNSEFEDVKEKIRKYIDKKDIAIESQYFLLSSLADDIKEEILYDDDDDEDDVEEDELSEFDEEDEPEDEPEPKDEPEQPKKVPIKKSNHKLKIAAALKNKPQAKRIKVKKDKDEIE